jgi:hypothetical protein
MLLIANDFHFWNLAKAGMFMKTIELLKKAGMLLIGLMLLDEGSLSSVYVIETSCLICFVAECS